MKFNHQGKEYDMPVRKFKDQKSADKFSKALDKKKKVQPQSNSRSHKETCSSCGMYGSKCYCGS